MSCGNPHKTPCTEVLAQVYAYLDREISQADCEDIRQHLDECGPCLREFGLDEAVKRLVAKHCGCDPAPADLRGKVLVRIRQVQAEIEVTDLSAVAAKYPLGRDRDTCPEVLVSTVRDRFVAVCLQQPLGLREFAPPRYPVMDGM